MANKYNKPKQKSLTKEEQEQLDKHLNEFAQFLYDVYQQKKQKEQN